MNTMRIPALLIASMAAAVPASPAWAQSYGYGRGYVAPPEEPPYVQYMSPRCRTLHHSLRARTVSSYQVIDGMRREYRRDCEEQESDARQRYYDERQDARRHKYDDWRDARKQAAEQYKSERAEVLAQRREQAGQHARSAQQSEQCAESFRILATKKARTDLTPGEMDDLRRFEQNVATRCGR